MSSYISSSESHRRFVLGLLALVFVSVAGLFALGIYLQPLNQHGALTRIGFYSERAFGWNRPQLTFPHTKLEFPASVADSGRYDSYHDVVVLGDSFSRIWPALQWQNHLAAATRWSVATLNINKIGPEQVLASKVFHKHPPRVLIVELVEENLPEKLEANTPSCGKISTSLNQGNNGDASPVFTPFPRSKNHLSGTTQRVERERLLSEIKLGFVRGYIWNNLRREFMGDAHIAVSKVELIRPAPFSSRNQQAMLVYKADYDKVKLWKKLGLNEMRCRIEAMRRQVEANGHTRFVLMVPPDKLTAYADFLKNKDLRNISTLAQLSGYSPEVIPRLDLALIAAIREGEQDVYLPDDTHWGSSGNQIAAETLLTFLQQP